MLKPQSNDAWLLTPRVPLICSLNSRHTMLSPEPGASHVSTCTRTLERLHRRGPSQSDQVHGTVPTAAAQNKPSSCRAFWRSLPKPKTQTYLKAGWGSSLSKVCKAPTHWRPELASLQGLYQDSGLVQESCYSSGTAFLCLLQ